MTLTQLILGLVIAIGGAGLISWAAYIEFAKEYSNPGYGAFRTFFPVAGLLFGAFFFWCQPAAPRIGRIVVEPMPLVAGKPFRIEAVDLEYDREPRLFHFDHSVGPPHVSFYLTDEPVTDESAESGRIGDLHLGDDGEPGDGYSIQVTGDQLSQPGRQRIAAWIVQYGKWHRRVAEFEVLAPSAGPMP